MVVPGSTLCAHAGRPGDQSAARRTRLTLPARVRCWLPPELRGRSSALAVRRLSAGAGNGTMRGRLAPGDSPASILAGRGGALDAGSTMRAHPRSIILAAALVAP